MYDIPCITFDNASNRPESNHISIRSQFFETQRRIRQYRTATRVAASTGLAHDILQRHLNLLDRVFNSTIASLSNEAYELFGEIIVANVVGGPTEVINALERLAPRFSVSSSLVAL